MLYALQVPAVTMDGAVLMSLSNRLDLQTQRDRLVDFQRYIRNAENSLLPDLNLVLEADVGGRGDSGWEGLNPDFKNLGYS
ncbi:MAG: hypothetical protein GY888_14525, partial [Planctomycetaceae bacterium]|nr:hypothetical protein [Planctomycetaceae bacterium]